MCFVKQNEAYDSRLSLVGSEMWISDRGTTELTELTELDDCRVCRLGDGGLGTTELTELTDGRVCRLVAGGWWLFTFQ